MESVVSDELKRLLVGDDFGIFPDEMTTEAMVAFRMRDLAEARSEIGRLAGEVKGLQGKIMSLDFAAEVKAHEKKLVKRQGHRIHELAEKNARLGNALKDIVILCRDAEVTRIGCEALGVQIRRAEVWRRMAVARKKNAEG